MSDLSPAFNKAVDHVVKICEDTLGNLEKSQNKLVEHLQELENRLVRIAGISEKLSDNRMTEACQSILIYKSKVERIKTRISALKRRIAAVETKIMIKCS
jgi:prefoldin subunit 5